MSTTAQRAGTVEPGVPELSALGRQLEMFRLHRGISKQSLARQAGTSRQQLWRVMTGKSELTSSLCERLAEVLAVDSRALGNPEVFIEKVSAFALGSLHANGGGADGGWRDGTGLPLAPQGADSTSRSLPLAEYLADPENVARTLATYPAGEPGRRLKRQYLDALEDSAGDASIRLHPAFFTLRGRVVNGEI